MAPKTGGKSLILIHFSQLLEKKSAIKLCPSDYYY